MPIEIGIRENAFYKAGEARAKATGLVALLEFRFGTLPRELRNWIDQATIEQLDHWFQLAYTSDTLEAVFPN